MRSICIQRDADETSAFQYLPASCILNRLFGQGPLVQDVNINRHCADIFVSNQLIFKDFSPAASRENILASRSLVGLECDRRVKRPGQSVTLPNELDEPLKILARVNRQIPEVEINR